MTALSKIIEWFAAKYEWFMRLILRGRHVHVSREKYIRKLILQYFPHASSQEVSTMIQTALQSSPTDVLSERQLTRSYRRLCWHYGVRVFLVSFLMTTVPDNLWIVILSCVLDLYLFQCLLFRAMQKIMILYGHTIDLESREAEDVNMILSVDRSGVMIGKHPLLQKMKSVLGFAAKQAVKKAGPKVVAQLSHSWFMVIRRQLIKWFSVVVARENVHSAFELLIPFTCAIISGLVSVIIFIPMCNKLKASVNKLEFT